MEINEILSKIKELGNKYFDEIFIQHKSVPEYNDLLFELITRLSIDNPELAKYYADYYANSINMETGIRINEFLLEHQCSIDLFNSYGIMLNYSRIHENPQSELKANELLKKMIRMAEEGTFNIDEYAAKKSVYATVDPLYPIKKDINNIHYVVSKYDWILWHIDALLDYTIALNYQFNMQDIDLINVILERPNQLNVFINRCIFDKEVFEVIYNTVKRDKHLVFDVLYERYPEYFNNKEVEVDVDDEEEFLQIITQNDFSKSSILLKLNIQTINRDFLEKVKQILGRKAVVSIKRNANGGYIYYTIDDLFEIDQKIEILAKSLRTNDGKELSPLEKFIGAYIIVTNYAIYKSTNGIDDSRSVYEIVKNDGNKGIVCAGYANLLLEILIRNGMGQYIADHDVFSEGEGTLKRDAFFKASNHARIMVHIKDDKYGVDALYMSDPTWDSLKEGEKIGRKKFTHILMTYEECLRDKDKFPNGARDLHIEKDDLQKISKQLGINAEELFHMPIDEDVIIRALCGVNRFISKGVIMPQKAAVGDDGYSLDEYNSAALQLGHNAYFIFDDKWQNFTFSELLVYLQKEYEIDSIEAETLLHIMMREKIGKNIKIDIAQEKINIYYSYLLQDKDGKYKYSDDDMEKLYQTLGVSYDKFPYINYLIKEVSINDKIGDVISDVCDNLENIEEKIEEVFDGIIHGDNMLK